MERKVITIPREHIITIGTKKDKISGRFVSMSVDVDVDYIVEELKKRGFIKEHIDNVLAQYRIQANQSLGNPFQKCEHCYCQRGIFINGQEHFVCCMCGHRRLVNPISFQPPSSDGNG